MAVTVTNNLTLVDDASSTTGWTFSTNKFSAVDASNREGTGVNCIGYQAAANEFNSFYHTLGASVDMSGGYTIFAPWMRTGGPGTFAQGGFCVLIGDGTDRIAYHVGGITDFGSTERGWSRFRLDTLDLPTTFTTVSGSETNLTLSNIVDIGGGIYSTPAPSGQAYNNWFDIVRYIQNGSAALTIGGGTTGDRGTWAEVVTEDASVSNAWGVIFSKVAGGKVYEVLFGLEIGDSGTGSSYFEDSDFQLFLNGTDMSAGNLDVDLLANSTGTNLFIIDSFQVTSVGTASNWDLSSANVDTMEVTNGSFTDMGTFDFPPSSATRKLNDCSFSNCGAITFQSSFDAKRNTFRGCGQITHGGADTTECVVSGYEGTAGTGALSYNLSADPDGEMDNMSFTKGTAATHAIQFGTSAPTTMTLRDMTFSGYNSSDGQNDSTLYFPDTGSDVTWTVNLVGCSGNISYRKARTGDTVNLVINPVTTQVTVKALSDGSVIEGATVLVWVTDSVNYFNEASVSITGSGTTATVSHTAHGLSTGDYVIIEGCNEDVYNGTYQVTVTGVDSYTYTTNETISSSPATGTPLSTMAVISGTTNSSGIITDQRSWSNNQDILGRVRKSSTSPYYKQGDITGTIDSTNGFSITIQLSSDE